MILSLAALSASCRSASEVEARRARVAEAVAVRAEQQRVFIPAAPRDLISDYSMPPFSVRQMFRWAPHEILWRWTIVNPEAHHAGFMLRRPLAVPEARTGMALYFELSPPDIAPLLSIGLIDEPDLPREKQALLDLTDYALPRRSGEEIMAFALPLSEFDALHADGVNWANIRGIHLQRAPDAVNDVRRIDLRNLQLAPDTWLKERGWGR